MAHILVIDDEVQHKELLAEFLSRDEHLVDSAENGKVALTLAENNVYDLVITDLLMPERDGFEVIIRLKQISPKTRIIAMTGGAPKIDVPNLLRTARLLGVDKALAKPLDFVNFKTVVKEVLELEK